MIKRAVLLFKLGISKLAASLKRFPEALFFCVVTTTFLIYMNHLPYSYEHMLLLQRITMVLALGVPLFLCVKVFFERRPSLNKGIIYVASLAVLILYYFTMFKDLEMVSVSTYTAFSIALYLAFTFIPYFLKKQNYELYVINLLSRFFTTYLYSVVLYLGLAAILFTIGALFTVKIPQRLYLDIFLAVAGVFAPAFFLGDIPQSGEEQQVENYSKFLRILLLYIIMPLLVAYSTILYAFFIKIIVTRQWPSNIVSHLVLWYSMISTLVVFLIYPLRDRNSWVNIFISIFPKAILPLLAMMFVSMGIRIKALGITENRYLVLVAGLWVTGCMLYLVIKKNARNIVMVISLAVITIMTVGGPWSSFSVSRYSQNLRFEALLKKHDMIKEGKVSTTPAALTEAEKAEITDILHYFDRKHELKHLKCLPEGFEMHQMADVFGFEATFGYGREKYFNHYAMQDADMVDISEYDFFIFSESLEHLRKSAEGEIKVYYMLSTGEIKILRGDEILYQNNVRDIAAKIHQKYPDDEELTREQMSFIDENENFKVLYMIDNFGGAEDPSTGSSRVDWIRFNLFIKER